MTGSDFFDTNILVYAYDSHEPDKQKKAQDMLKQGIINGNAVISTQVLGEFFTVVTRRIPQPISVFDASEIINNVSVMNVQEIDLLIVKRAIETLDTYKISYWDSLIVAAAEGAGCERIMTEDLNHEQLYYGIIATNPFS
ncbi:MAG: PIN domain-containing protein [Thermodesulfobacteriota bacterium]|nr:PIN domain-containing protein [Thermodesulfobacteriota bacterium]